MINIYTTKKTSKYLIEQNPLVTIGNHTSNHYNLSKCSFELQEEEIVNNHNFIETFGISVQHLLFHSGKKSHFSEETIRILSRKSTQYLFNQSNIYRPKG